MCPYLPGVTSSLNQEKSKVTFTWANHRSVHTKKLDKYLSNLPPGILPPFKNMEEKDIYKHTSELPTCPPRQSTSPHNSCKSSWITMNPIYHLNSSSTYSIGIDITVYGNCFNAHLLTCFDDLPYRKWQLSIFKIPIVLKINYKKKKLKRSHTYSACNLSSVGNKEFFKSLKGKE